MSDQHLIGTQQDDTLVGADGNDWLEGLAGNDTLIGNGGNDILNGGEGSDTYLFGIGFGTDTILNGDPGYASSFDIVMVTAPISLANVLFRPLGPDLSMEIVSSGDRLILSGLLGPSNADQIDAISFSDGSLATIHVGTAGADFLVSDAGTGIFVGGEGNDVLSGSIDPDIYIYRANDGVDRIDDFAQSGPGNELWFVGVGSRDSITISAEPSFLNVSLDGQTVVRINGFNAQDALSSNRIQTFRFDDGSELSYQDLIARGFDFFAVPGNSPFTGTNVTDRFHGSEAMDVFGSGAGDDVLSGAGGDDQLFGFEDDDYLDGGAGGDLLDGGAGNDTLDGGAGDDALNGGPGSDTYLFDRTSGHDEISEQQANPGDIDTLIFGENITAQDLIVTADAFATLQIDILGSDASIRINSWFNPQIPSHVERFVFSDGSVLTDSQIDTMIEVNSPPVIDNPIADQTAQDEVPFTLVVPQNTFSDPDTNDVLTYSARLATGDPLPGWLSFDASTRTFAGTPPPTAAGTITVRVAATDHDGLSASDLFNLTVLYDGIINGTNGPDILNGTNVDDVIFGFGGNDVLDGGSGFDTLRGGTGDDSYVINDSMGGPTTLTVNNWPGSAATYALNTDTGTFTPIVFDGNGDGQIDHVRFVYRDIVFPPGHSFTVELSTRQLGTNLAPGTYLDAQRAAFAAPGHPGLDVTGDGLGFNTISGSFTVGEATFDYTGPTPGLLTLSVDFEFSSTDFQSSPITGTLNYNYAAAGSIVHDDVIENAGEGIDTVLSRFSYVLPANIENLTLTGSANISGSGNELDNVITGNSGDNVLFGAAGNDILSGGAGRDRLEGGAGFDSLQGGSGDDSYVIDGPVADSIIENPVEGIDKALSSVSYTLTPNVEVLTLTGNADINGTGNELGNLLNGNAGANVLVGRAGSDRLLAGAGNDVLDGGADLDTLQGGAGDDTYMINDVVALSGSTSLTMRSEPGDFIGAGNTYSFSTSTGTFTPALFDRNLDGQIDYVRVFYRDSSANGNSFFLDFSTAQLGTPITPGLYADAQRGSFAPLGSPGLDVFGNGRGSNQLFGSFTVAGADIDYSGSTPVLRYFSVNFEQHSESPSAPALSGTLIYDIEPAGTTATDSVIENAGEGIDKVMSSVTYALTANVENLTLTGIAAINGTGNSLDNVLIGNSASNTLSGGGGNDTMDGGLGTDTMIGGLGNDTYIVDTYSFGDFFTDLVIENAGEGTDTVQSSVTYTLSANVENLTLTGATDENGTGNSLDNVLTGNGANNGLIGGAGNDTLNGGAGTDTLIGGMNNDTYIVDSTTDTILEYANEGTDSVLSSVTYMTLAANVENLTLTGASAINGAGNTLNNVLTGNSANNTLNGGLGADIMTGGLGDDTYVVDNAGDAVIENVGEGKDLVQSSVTYTLAANVENLTLTGTSPINGAGNATGNVITGNSAKNTLSGGGGNDTLIGLGGADTMIGGTGDDTYIVDAPNEVLTENAGEGSDTIQSLVGWTLGANFENLVLTGSAGINGTGNTVANLLVGNMGNNVLTGAAGNDVLQGLAGNDVLNDTAGNTLFDGGAGTDTMTGNANNEMFIGGLGNDTLTTGAGADIIAFNKGAGQDIVNASTGMDNVLSLGGGINYASLTFTKSGKNLILKTGGTDQVTFKDWYAQGNCSVATLQVFTEAMAGYNPGGSNTLLDNKVEQFNFTALASAFDSAGQVNGWALTNALLSAHLSGSDTQAIGGDLAYQYGANGNLAGVGLAQAQQVLNAPQFGTANQTLRPAAELQQGQIRLS